MRGAHAAPGRGAVHDVVVDQRERVQHLERRAGIGHDRVVGVAASPDQTPVAERRPQPLAACEHEGAERLERRHDLGIERTPPLDLGVEERTQTGFDPFSDHREAGGGTAHRRRA